MFIPFKKHIIIRIVLFTIKSLSVVQCLVSGDASKKRKRGRPPKSETFARRQAEREGAEKRNAAKAKAAPPQKAEEEEDDVVDAGAIDDPEGQR